MNSIPPSHPPLASPNPNTRKMERKWEHTTNKQNKRDSNAIQTMSKVMGAIQSVSTTGNSETTNQVLRSACGNHPSTKQIPDLRTRQSTQSDRVPSISTIHHEIPPVYPPTDSPESVYSLCIGQSVPSHNCPATDSPESLYSLFIGQSVPSHKCPALSVWIS